MNPDTLPRALEHHRMGRVSLAESLYRELLVADPNDPNALHLMGLLLSQTGRAEEAVSLLVRSVQASPDVAHFRSNLASVLGKLGRLAEAAEHLRRAVRLQPDLAEGHNNLGVALESLGQLEEAMRCYHEALRLRPAYAECHANLGNVFQKTGPRHLAIQAYENALAIRPDYRQAQVNLAGALAELGRLDEAIAWYRRASELRPHDPRPHSGLIFTLHNHPDLTPRELFDEHLAWAQRHARPFYPPEPFYPNDPSPQRRLRIGYVSGCFHAHPVTRFFEPILASHDRSGFDVVCYSDVARADAVTDRLMSYGHGWVNVRGQSDERVAARIRQDAIDILVDLHGHMPEHRLLVFARKPAPVQVTYLGYPDTTGLATMDFRITDSQHDPAGLTEHYHTEQLVRLDPCCWCYRPDTDGPDVNGLPALRDGRITFAVLNRLAKVTSPMMRLWSQVLQRTPGSRLMVLLGPGAGDESIVRDLFAAHDIARDRLVLVGRTARAQYLAQYHSVDVALDTFPYNGHTTTCDALWMGVPVVTLVGRTHVARAGLSVLGAVGLERLACRTPDAYVGTAVALAQDVRALARLRETLRARMKASPLCDARVLTTRLEAAYRRVWLQWCGHHDRTAHH